MDTPVMNRTLEQAAYRAVLARCRAIDPEAAFASHFLTGASRHSLFCIGGVIDQLREVIADGKSDAPLGAPAAPTSAAPASCGSGGCGSCGGAESPEKRRDVCLAVLDHLYSGEPTGKATLDGFFTVATRQQIPRELFERLIHGLYTWNTTRRCATWAKLHALCDETGGVAALIAFRAMLPVSAGSELTPKSQSLITAWGASLRLTWALEHIGRDKLAGRQLLPMDDLVRFGVLESALNSWAKAGNAGGDEKWKSLLAFEVERAENLYRGGCGALSLLSDRDRKAAAIWGEGWCEKMAALRSGACDGLSNTDATAAGFWKRITRLPAAIKRLETRGV